MDQQAAEVRVSFSSLYPIMKGEKSDSSDSSIAFSVRVIHNPTFAAGRCSSCRNDYYLRMEKDFKWLAYPPKLTVELGSYVDGEAHGWVQ